MFIHSIVDSKQVIETQKKSKHVRNKNFYRDAFTKEKEERNKKKLIHSIIKLKKKRKKISKKKKKSFNIHSFQKQKFPVRMYCWHQIERDFPAFRRLKIKISYHTIKQFKNSKGRNIRIMKKKKNILIKSHLCINIIIRITVDCSKIEWLRCWCCWKAECRLYCLSISLSIELERRLQIKTITILSTKFIKLKSKHTSASFCADARN